MRVFGREFFCVVGAVSLVREPSVHFGRRDVAEFCQLFFLLISWIRSIKVLPEPLVKDCLGVRAEEMFG